MYIKRCLATNYWYNNFFSEQVLKYTFFYEFDLIFLRQVVLIKIENSLYYVTFTKNVFIITNKSNCPH